MLDAKSEPRQDTEHGIGESDATEARKCDQSAAMRNNGPHSNSGRGEDDVDDDSDEMLEKPTDAAQIERHGCEGAQKFDAEQSGECAQSPMTNKRKHRSRPKCAGRKGYWDPLPGKRLNCKRHPPWNYVPDAPCIFSTIAPGSAAQGSCCMFCNPKHLEATLSKPYGSRSVTRCLKAFKKKDESVYNAALARTPERFRKLCADRVTANFQREEKSRDPALAAAAREKAEERKESTAAKWKRVLVGRKHWMAKPKKAIRYAYKKHVLDDQNRCWNKFFPTTKQAIKKARMRGLTEPNKEDVEARRIAAEQAFKVAIFCHSFLWPAKAGMRDIEGEMGRMKGTATRRRSGVVGQRVCVKLHTRTKSKADIRTTLRCQQPGDLKWRK